MPIYDKPVRILMKEMADELLVTPGSEFKREDARQWFQERYPKIKWGTVTAHLCRLSVNSRSRIHYNAKESEDDVFYQLDQSRYRRYIPEQDPAPVRQVDDNKKVAEILEGEDEDPKESSIEGSGEFAYERDLRNYLAKNLNTIENGLSLYEDEGIRGIEFPVGGRFIDILAVDSEGNLVVIELKVSRGYDRVVGQLLRYMAWIQKNLAEHEAKVRGIIVARDISEDLLLSCSLVQNVELFEYKLLLSLQRIDQP